MRSPQHPRHRNRASPRTARTLPGEKSRKNIPTVLDRLGRVLDLEDAAVGRKRRARQVVAGSDGRHVLSEWFLSIVEGWGWGEEEGQRDSP